MRENTQSVARISPPRLGEILPRKRLFQKLDRGGSRPVVWISAPAGSGKTALVASYLQERSRPCLWYTLEAGDGDPGTFFHYLGLAARQATPRRRTPLPRLTPEYLAALPTFAHRFFGALYRRLDTPAVVVFDNYHDIPPRSPLHALMPLALTLIPEGVMVVLISRHDPPPSLVQLQADRKIQTLGWSDLRLTEAESLRLARLLGRGRSEQAAIRRLHQETGGWAAGLVLMLGETQETGGAPAAGGDCRQILFDYFAGETLQQVDDQVRDFLLKTALLPRMHVRAARSLTGNPRAGQILERLRRQNFFTLLHPGSPPAYEYHALFRAFLVAQGQAAFPPHELAGLRRAAAGLLAESGQFEAAVDLYRQGEDWAPLVELILGNAQHLSQQGRFPTLEQWIRALPRPVAQAEPWLLFWLGCCRLAVDPPAARRLYEQAFEGFRGREEAAGLYLSWCGVVDTFVYYWEDFRPLDPWIERLGELRRRHPEFPSRDIEARLISSAVCALAYRQPQHPRLPYWAGRADTVVHDVTLPTTLRLTIAAHLCHYYAWLGDLPKLSALIPEVRLMAADCRQAPLAVLMAGMVEVIESWMTASRESCERLLHDSLEAASQTGIDLMSLEMLSQGVYLQASAGDPDAAGACLERMAALLGSVPRLSVGHYHYLAGWVAFLRGDTALAQEHASLGLRASLSCGVPFAEALNRLGLVQITFAMGEHRKAAYNLGRAARIGRDMGSHLIEFHCGCLRAFFAFETGQPARGLAALRGALACGKAHGFVNHPWWRADVMASLCLRALEHDIEPDYARHLIHKRHLAPAQPPLHVDNWPWPVRIYTLGRFSLLIDDQPVRFSGKAQKRPLDLLKALIAFGGRDVAVHRLTDALWPDAEGGTAYQALNMALQRLRQILGDRQAIDLSEGRLTLDPRHCWVDSWAFERLAGDARTLWSARPRQPRDRRHRQAMERAEKALALYHGPFLGDGGDETWALSTRERLRRKFLRTAEALGQTWEAGHHWRHAIACYERGLDVDDLAEDFYFHLMRCHQQLGHTARAVQVYRRCKEMLALHLQLAPSARTRSLYRQLRDS
ncbi:MAG TPA: hypothetical protein ENK12_02110 [Gammaproteobacteria bacterium]|nr:hypothetical protein [Gammaproteobacteria bacterium]